MNKLNLWFYLKAVSNLKTSTIIAFMKDGDLTDIEYNSCFKTLQDRGLFENERCMKWMM
jgi:hypothetical protein